jgi:hypothetical protein
MSAAGISEQPARLPPQRKLRSCDGQQVCARSERWQREHLSCGGTRAACAFVVLPGRILNHRLAAEGVHRIIGKMPMPLLFRFFQQARPGSIELASFGVS